MANKRPYTFAEATASQKPEQSILTDSQKNGVKNIPVTYFAKKADLDGLASQVNNKLPAVFEFSNPLSNHNDFYDALYYGKELVFVDGNGRRYKVAKRYDEAQYGRFVFECVDGSTLYRTIISKSYAETLVDFGEITSYDISSSISSAVSSEATARSNADTALGARIDAIKSIYYVDAGSSWSTFISKVNANYVIAINNSTYGIFYLAYVKTNRFALFFCTDGSRNYKLKILNNDGVIEFNLVETIDEPTARQAADSALDGKITAEATTRGNADTALGARIDAEASARANADTALDGRVTTLEQAMPSKANSADVYTKGETDASLALKADKSTTYTKTEVDSALNGKANASHTHVVNDITDFPSIPNTTSELVNDSDFTTKTYVDEELAKKADVEDVPELNPNFTAGETDKAATCQSIAEAIAQAELDPLSIVVDQTYNPSSTNAQSGVAVNKAFVERRHSAQATGGAIFAIIDCHTTPNAYNIVVSGIAVDSSNGNISSFVARPRVVSKTAAGFTCELYYLGADIIEVGFYYDESNSHYYIAFCNKTGYTIGVQITKCGMPERPLYLVNKPKNSVEFLATRAGIRMVSFNDVVSTFSQTGTYPVNGTAVASALAGGTAVAKNVGCTTLTSSNNLDSLDSPIGLSIYSWKSSSFAINCPRTDKDSIMENLKYSDNFIVQKIFLDGVVDKYWLRSKSGSSWSSWRIVNV